MPLWGADLPIAVVGELLAVHSHLIATLLATFSGQEAGG